MSNQNNKFAIFTHSDLDGISSYLVLSWILGTKPLLIPTTPSKLANDYAKWSKEYEVDNFKKIFFLDLDTSSISEEIDMNNIVVIDHHDSHVMSYKHAKFIIEPEYTSAAKLIYDKLGKSTKFTDAQKLLMVLADDYDCAGKKTPVSNDLNIVFHHTNRKIDSFITNFWKGFTGFTPQQKKTIEYYKQDVANFLNQARTYFKGSIPVDGKKVEVIAVFADTCVQELSEYIINRFKPEVCMIIINKSLVSIRRRDDSNFDCGKFAVKVCKGGGHEAAGGGKVDTDEFQAITKLLKSISNG